MKAENILKSDVLDIIFENKNKEYGAYQLRKQYTQRVKKSLLMVTGLVIAFGLLQSMKPFKRTSTVYVGQVTDYVIDPYKDKEPKKNEPLPKEKPKIKQPIAQAIYTPPLIVPDPLANKQMADIKALDTAAAGTSNIAGPKTTGVVGVIPGPPDSPNTGGGTGDDTKGKPDPLDDGPVYNPSQYPEFPGGIDGLKSFMLRHLHQPDDVEEGEKIVVIAKFVVSKTGSISHIEITQTGREDLDNEVLRVIKKMPVWKPGLQNGLPIDVYYKLPVTFTGAN